MRVGLRADAAHIGHMVGAFALASADAAFGGDLVDAGEVIGSQGHIACGDVLRHAVGVARAPDRDDVILLRERPCQRQLRQIDAFARWGSSDSRS